MNTKTFSSLRHLPHLALCFALSACAYDPYAAGKAPGVRYRHYEHYEPSLVQLARLRAGKGKGENPFEAYFISDLDVVNYADHMKSILRSKFTGARFARYTSATTQVLLSGLAGAASAYSWGASTVTGLALGSAGVPQIGGIFNAKVRAESYQDAVRMIEEAEVDYLTQAGSPSGDRLTDSGVDLYRRVSTTIHVVEKALVGQLPTLKEMKDATGETPVGGTGGGKPTGKTLFRRSGMKTTESSTRTGTAQTSHSGTGSTSGTSTAGTATTGTATTTTTTTTTNTRSVHDRQKALIAALNTLPEDKVRSAAKKYSASDPASGLNDLRDQLQITIGNTKNPDTLTAIEKDFGL